MSGRQIIMNFSLPPSGDDLNVMASDIFDMLPEELSESIDGMDLVIEDLIDDITLRDLDLDDPFEIVALFKNGKEIAPGIEAKTANDDSILILYRRPILDMWCESEEDLPSLLRQIIIEELGRNFDFSDDEIDEMIERTSQGLF